MRVHELAKELKIDSKELIEHLKEMEIQVKSHMSSVAEDHVDAVRKKFGGGSAKEEAQPVRTVKKKKKPVEEKEKPSAEEAEAPAESNSSTETVEQRVSTTVIRRRKKAKPAPPPPEPEPQESVLAEPESETIAGKAVPEEEETPEQEATQTKPATEPESAPEPETVAEKAAPEEEETPSETAEPEKKEPPVQQKVKKLKLREKESTPARIIDRIDLGPKKEPPQPAESAEPEKEEATEAAPKAKDGAAPAAATPEKDDRVVLKQKSKRKKFKWQQDIVDDEEGGTDLAPPRHKRVRYKVKEKSAKSKRQKGDSLQLINREPEKTVPKAIKRKIKVQDGITVSDLAKRMGVKATDLIKKLVELGVMSTINQVLDNDTASLIATEFEYEIEAVSIAEETIFEEQATDAAEDLQPRCPVVTVMGHVDHGKTSLLDTIRKTDVVAGEKGGITQHIGAYRVATPNGDIAFVDTPGHEAFTTMRARGAQVTDIVILVVAAEEGVKPQTIEAIDHAKAAEVPIIVAVNKIDKPEADPDRVRQELSQYGLLSEEWGGENIFVDVSAKANKNIDKLLEMVLLQSEMLELKANPNKSAKGTIIEARLDRGRGAIATVLVQEGTLHNGDSFVSRHNFGKVRALIDDHGKTVDEVGPGTPVEILGFSSVPEAGDVFLVVDDKKARQTSDYWQQKKREEDLRKDAKVNLENFFSQVGQEEVKELRVVLKSDVQGSAEALQQSLENLSTEEVKVQVIHNSVGAVSLKDVMLASASNAIIIGFNVKSEAKVLDAAQAEKIDVRFYGIIYEVLDDVKNAMIGMLAPKYNEKTEGKAEIRQVFDISKMGTVAGCFVIEGKIINGSKARVVRGSDVVHEGEITSLKHFKDDAREVLSGQECGIFLGSFKGFEEGDIIESFTLEEMERTL